MKNYSQLDAFYVGRVSNRLRDAVQECITPTGFDAALYRSRVDDLARDILARTFEEPVPTALWLHPEEDE